MPDALGPAHAASMTGFARAAGEVAGTAFAWEARSVNAKGLDVRVRLPAGFDRLDVAVRERVAKRFRRGSLTLGLEVRRAAQAGEVTVNRALLDQLLRLKAELGDRVDPAPARFEALLALKGVLEVSEEAGPASEEALDPALLAALDTALDQMAAARNGEGERLAAILAGQVDAIEELTARARGLAAGVPGQLAERLNRQVAALTEALPEERLAQEIALLASRADTTEELDRLDAHVASARELLAGREPIGRRLDFLAQEFHREANTLTSKSGDIGLTRLGIELKTVIEQFREQVQNVE